MSVGVGREFTGLGVLGNIGTAVIISLLSVLQPESSVLPLWQICGSFPIPVLKSWFSEWVLGHEHHNLVFWAIKIVKLVRNSACISLLPFIESMPLIFCIFQRTGLGKNPYSINYANEVRIIFAEND
jgi:hypothetical protein